MHPSLPGGVDDVAVDRQRDVRVGSERGLVREGDPMNKDQLIAIARARGIYPPENATPEQMAEFRARQSAHERKFRSKYAHLQKGDTATPR